MPPPLSLLDVAHDPSVVLLRWKSPASREVADVSPSVELALGCTRADLKRGEPAFLELVHPADRPTVANLLADRGGRDAVGASLDYRIRRPDRTEHWVNERILAAGPPGDGTDVLSMLQDISDRKARETELEQLSRHLERARAQAGLSYWRWSFGEERLTDFCPRCGEIFGLGSGDLPLTDDALLALTHPEDRERLRDVYERADAEQADFEVHYRIVRPDGTVRMIFEQGEIERDTAGQAVALVGTLQDITRITPSTTGVTNTEIYDALTQLPGRQLLGDRLNHALASAQRSGSRVALLFIDLDGFKKVNDTAGHLAGDRVLREVGARLQDVVRASDTAARYGGDEFCVVMTDVTDENSIRSFGRKILDALSRRYHVDAGEFDIGCSIGVAVFPDHGDSPNGLLDLADKAMYSTKRHGEGGLHIADELAGG